MKNFFRTIMTGYGVSRSFCTLCAVMAVMFSAAAEPADSLWKAGVKSYSDGDYKGALETFLQMEEAGFRGAGLYYNIANSYLKSASGVGMAICYYERALREDPSFEDAEVNLAIAKEMTLDKIEEVPEFFLITWIRNFRNIFSSDMWACLFLIFLVMTATGVLLFIYARSLALKKWGFGGAIFLAAAAIISLSFSLSLKSLLLSEDHGVVIVPVGSVKGSPSHTDNSLFILHEGTQVEIVEGVGEWSRIELSDGRQGWIEKKNLIII